MHGDHEETRPEEPGGWDWQSGCLVALLIGFVAFSWVASGCSAQGAEPPQVMLEPPQVMLAVRAKPPAKVETPAAGVGGGGVGSAPPPVLLGWHVPQPDGTTRFVPATNTVVPAPVGGPAPRPFAPPAVGSWGGGPTATAAPTAAPFNPGWSPAGRTFPATPTVVRPAGRGARTSDCPT